MIVYGILSQIFSARILSSNPYMSISQVDNGLSEEISCRTHQVMSQSIKYGICHGPLFNVRQEVPSTLTG